MNGLPENPVTNASGNYSGTVTYGWSGTVTPQKAGYNFTPPSTVYTNVTSNQTQNYTGVLQTFTITGTVTSGGSPLSGVTMSGLPGNPVTGGDGSYSGTVTYGWSGTVTPQKTGYNFTPSSTPYTNVTSNQTQNYTAVLQTFTITGTVTWGGSPLSGVTMSGLPGSPVTGANGAYSATVDYGWSGTVTPQKTGYNFTPSSTPYTNVTSNQTQNYTGVLQIEGVIFVSLDGICNFYTPCSSSIQNAISTADTQTTIRITEETYDEDVTLNSPKELILQGGWDSTFTTIQSSTKIDGSMTISDGTLTVENIVLQ
jgi:outer membrane lipoprotein SlyB